MPDRTSPPPQSVGAFPSGSMHEVHWSEICPWLILVKALRVALLVRVLLLAAFGVAITQAGWAVLLEQLAPELEIVLSPREQLPTPILSDDPRELLETFCPAQWLSGSPVSGWYWLTAPFLELGNLSQGNLVQENRELASSSTMCHLLRGLWAIVVWAFLGGMIGRIAAWYLIRGEVLSIVQAAQYSARAWLATIGSPLIALAALLGLSLPLVLLGLLLRIDLLASAAALGWLVIFAWGLVLSVVAVGLVLGWPLMWACQAVERSDAFDGVSRCYAYVYQRPLHLAFFAVFAVGLSLVGDQVVALFADFSVGLSETALSLGMGVDRAQSVLGGDLEASPVPIATKLIDWWKWGFDLIAVSFPLACLWSMSVGIYLLQRRLIDETEIDEIELPIETNPNKINTAEQAATTEPTGET